MNGVSTGRTSNSSSANSVIEHGRAADLIVVSRASKNGWIDDVAERAAVESGRPVIVIPEGSNMPAIDTEMVVAWKNSKEATRAVFDALPLLEKARRVRLLTVIEDGTNDGERTSSAELAASLLRHGIKVDVEFYSKGCCVGRRRPSGLCGEPRSGLARHGTVRELPVSRILSWRCLTRRIEPRVCSNLFISLTAVSRRTTCCMGYDNATEYMLARMARPRSSRSFSASGFRECSGAWQCAGRFLIRQKELRRVSFREAR